MSQLSLPIYSYAKAMIAFVQLLFFSTSPLTSWSQQFMLYRSVGNGQFQQAANWQVSADGVSWTAATQSPDQAQPLAGMLVQSGDTMVNAAALNLSVDLEMMPGAVIVLNADLTLPGYLVGAGSIKGAAQLVFASTGPQQIVGNFTVENLLLNNPDSLELMAGAYGQQLNITGTYQASAGFLVTNDSLVFKSSAAGTAAHLSGLIKGQAGVERYIPAKADRKFAFLSTAVTQTIRGGWQQQIHITGGQTAATGGTACAVGATTGQPTPNNLGFDASLTNNPSLYTYEDLIQIGWAKWVSYADADQTLFPGYGFRVLVRGPRSEGCALLSGASNVQNAVTLSATGELAQGPVAVVLSAAPFHLRGNPYAAPINWEAPDFVAMRAANNISNTFWVYNPGNASGQYSVYNAGTLTNKPSGYLHDSVLASGQAFFIRNDLTQVRGIPTFFQESYKTNLVQPGLFRTAQNNQTNTDNRWGWSGLVRLGLYQGQGGLTADSTRKDETILRFSLANPAVSDTAFGRLDAQQFSAAASRLSSLKGNALLSIHTRPLRTAGQDDTVRLSLVLPAAGQYRLMISDTVGLQAMQVLLRDKFLHAETVLQVNVPLTIATTADPASQGNERFELIFRTASTLATKFISLQASRHAASLRNEIRFATEEDGNTKAYQLEASSDGGQHFEPLAGVVVNASPQPGSFHYQLNDERTLTASQTLHYRIKALGAVPAYSAIVKLSPQNLFTVTAYPNPVKDELTVQFSPAANPFSLRLVDVRGRVAMHQNVSLQAAAARTMRFSAAHLPAGAYLLQAVSDSGETLASSFITKE